MRPVTVAASVVITLLLTLFSRADEEQTARFQGEYPAAARRLVERYARAKGACRLWRTLEGTSELSPVDDAKFAIDHGFEKLFIGRNLSPGPGGKDATFDIVYCVGKNTDFYLTRLPGSPTFNVEGIGSNPSDRDAYRTMFGRFVNAHFAVQGTPLSRLMEHPKFHLLDATSTTKGSRNLVKIEFVVGDLPARNHVAAILDPAAGWVITSMTQWLEDSPDRKTTVEIEFGSPMDGYYPPRLVQYHSRPGESSSCEFTEWEFAPTPKAEFTMPFYGLPDLTAKPGSQTNTLAYWLGGIAVLGAGGAVLLRKFAGRVPARAGNV